MGAWGEAVGCPRLYLGQDHSAADMVVLVGKNLREFPEGGQGFPGVTGEGRPGSGQVEWGVVLAGPAGMGRGQGSPAHSRPAAFEPVDRVALQGRQDGTQRCKVSQLTAALQARQRRGSDPGTDPAPPAAQQPPSMPCSWLQTPLAQTQPPLLEDTPPQAHPPPSPSCLPPAAPAHT